MRNKIKEFFSWGKLNPKFIAKGLFISCIFYGILLFVKFIFSVPAEETTVLKMYERIIFTCNILIVIIKIFLLKLISETIYLITKASKTIINNE